LREYIVTVMAQDRVGIVRDVSGAIAGLDGDITHLSQTVLRGYFTLIISARIPGEPSELAIGQAVERTGAIGELAVNVRPYETVAAETRKTERFVLSMRGPNSVGIIATVTAFLADKGISVDDFYSYVHEDKHLILAQLAVPDDIDLDAVQQGLENVSAAMGQVTHLQHENIFKATCEVDSVTAIEENR
jgi:glycine cleavage system transcriptional repressor